jgi:HEAT repeat protein
VGQPRHLQERGLLTASQRRRSAALAGHQSDVDTARGLLGDPVAAVRATALAALARLNAITTDDIVGALRDPEGAVRMRGCEVAASSGLGGETVVELLDDSDDAVVEVAAWALGELSRADAVAPLARVATGHRDALAREAAVAALGAIGDPAGLPAILAATTDKPAIRRRAVLALAPFDGPEVDEALSRAITDRDWQVRAAAELLRS